MQLLLAFLTDRQTDRQTDRRTDGLIIKTMMYSL